MNDRSQKKLLKKRKGGYKKGYFLRQMGTICRYQCTVYRRVLYWTLFSPDESDSSVERALTWVDKVRSAIAIYSLQVNKNYLIDWQKQPKPFHQTDVIGDAHKICVWKHLHCSIFRQSSWTRTILAWKCTPGSQSQISLSLIGWELYIFLPKSYTHVQELTSAWQ